MDVFLRGLSALFLYQVAEVVGRKAKLGSKILDRRQAGLHRLAGVEIIVQQFLETGQQVGIDFFTGNELAFIEACAIVQQQLNIDTDQCLAMIVYRMIEFFRYLVETVEDDVPFPFGEV